MLAASERIGHSLRQHVQQNWQLNPTTKRISSQSSCTFMKCIEQGNALRTEKARKDSKNTEECSHQEGNEPKTRDFLSSCYRSLTEGAQRIIDNIGVSINNTKNSTNPWSRKILNSMLFLSGKSHDEFSCLTNFYEQNILMTT
ncbi:hypothetical protein KPH14_005288 [Odynerus spinipes]|uniref:Uncharacterized protein n=1 Tax=Odynerus spinipes TaxID=1348599 RepID=A0AAD9RCQ6_9HYME|nr:hypothetical protein KPH14_005288 [Odynerus spinipes]